LGADDTINYKSTPDWDREVFRLTDKVGVDHVVEVARHALDLGAHVGADRRGYFDMVAAHVQVHSRLLG